MKIHADLTQHAVVHTEELSWVDSPMVGVQRKMIERDGDEVARATSLVRYAPGSSFSAHTHDGGEEFLVLEGVFSDEFGDYGPGTYIRNPVGSSHTPFSQDGCIILVKLWQMVPEDSQRVVMHPQALMAEYDVSLITLHSYESELVQMIRLSAGESFRLESEERSELFILAGAMMAGDSAYASGSWVRRPGGAALMEFSSSEGCLFYLKTGHLR